MFLCCFSSSIVIYALDLLMKNRVKSLSCFLNVSLVQQTQVIAAAAAGVAAEGLSPKEAKVEAENAAQLSVALVENAIVMLMLVEDHLRLQSKLSNASRAADISPSPLSLVSPLGNRSNSSTNIGESSEPMDDRRSLLSDSAGLPLDVCIMSRFARTNGLFSLVYVFCLCTYFLLRRSLSFICEI